MELGMKKVFVGTYEFGYEHIRLYLRSGTGAETDLMPKDKGITVIEIGADRKEWRQIVGSLLHEAQEIPMQRLGYSYSAVSNLNQSTANCVFMMTHEQFDECCHRAGDLLARALPDLARAWTAWKKLGRKKR